MSDIQLLETKSKFKKSKSKHKLIPTKFINQKTNSNSINELSNSFEIFSSALYISQYEKINPNTQSPKNLSTDESLSVPFDDSSSELDKKNEYLDGAIQLSPSYEKCLLNELLDTISNDPTEKKIENTPKIEITKKLFSENSKDYKYEDPDSGYEFQLKFIENCMSSILPNSYKKKSTVNKNNKYISNNNYNKKEISCFNYKEVENENKYDEIKFSKKLKILKEYKEEWICNKCGKSNRGYRTMCISCKNYLNGKNL